MRAEPVALMVDVAFALQADEAAPLPPDYRGALAQSLEAELPWLHAPAEGEPAPGVHRLNLAAGAQALLSQRTRLTLRVPRERAGEAWRLAGRALALGALRLRVGAAQQRELQPWGTMYAHFVAAAPGEGERDEGAFLQEVEAALGAIGVQGRAICGRAQQLEAGTLRGHSLMVDGLSAEHALRLMDRGLGPHRRLGCGLFVPHKSAAAVGTPP